MKRVPRYIKNPEYERHRADVADQFGFPHEDRFPEEHEKQLPEDGGWIQLLMAVHVGRLLPDGAPKSVVVPHLSIWYAVPTKTNSGLHQAIIQTPNGAVHVWPHEYNRCNINRFLTFSEKEGFYTHFLSQDGAFDEAAMFYLRSRGIGKADAQRMLLATGLSAVSRGSSRIESGVLHERAP